MKRSPALTLLVLVLVAANDHHAVCAAGAHWVAANILIRLLASTTGRRTSVLIQGIARGEAVFFVGLHSTGRIASNHLLLVASSAEAASLALIVFEHGGAHTLFSLLARGWRVDHLLTLKQDVVDAARGVNRHATAHAMNVVVCVHWHFSWVNKFAVATRTLETSRATAHYLLLNSTNSMIHTGCCTVRTSNRVVTEGSDLLAARHLI